MSKHLHRNEIDLYLFERSGNWNRARTGRKEDNRGRSAKIIPMGIFHCKLKCKLKMKFQDQGKNQNQEKESTCKHLVTDCVCICGNRNQVQILQTCKHLKPRPDITPNPWLFSTIRNLIFLYNFHGTSAALFLHVQRPQPWKRPRSILAVS